MSEMTSESGSSRSGGVLVSGWVWALAFLIWIQPVVADSGVEFQDIAVDGGAGLAYQRAPSHTEAIWEDFRAQVIFPFFNTPLTPLKSRGAPGVALLDHDGDGDLDIYVTNGPGVNNSLFSNQLLETGALSFVDVGATAGVGAFDHDSSGVCYGDIDNDGDEDLFVVSNFDENRLFESNGDGTYSEISAASGLSDDETYSVGCSFGDVDGDGLLDVAVANAFDMTNQLATATPEPFLYNQHNQLYRNTGGNVFVDVSESSGFLDQVGFPEGFEGSPTVTWALAMVDYDLDGDTDIITADDQAAVPLPRDGGVVRGIFHLWDNDGTGHFTDLTVEKTLNYIGSWMGLSFADVNHDGALDFFSTSVGDYATTLLTPLDPVYGDFFNYQLGDQTSRWFLGSSDGSFSRPDVGELVATPFGWGTSAEDYDNDGDTDFVFHGGMMPGPVVQTCPAAMLENDGTGRFSYDADSVTGSTDHELRNVQGMAMGDLDGDGFVDVVSVSNFDIPPDSTLATYNHAWGSPFDFGRYSQHFVPTGEPLVAEYSGVVYADGTLSVEINSGGNGNRSVEVKALGTRGLTTGGVVNRDGIGAVVELTPDTGDSDSGGSDSDSGSDSDPAAGRTAMKPVLGGSSYASQDSLELTFGLGSLRRGNVDVLWPGGVRNRLYKVRRDQRIIFPEIPCSYDGDWASFRDYKRCVRDALDELVDAGVLDQQQKNRFFGSAKRAYRDEQ
ncbi:MAG: CRTAC1 family protein [bacterium]|nr:CRTAC1 family protein [bacterium]